MHDTADDTVGGTEAEKTRTRILMLCGIPGSGKSRLAAELARELDDAEVIATDEIGGRGGRYRKLAHLLDERIGERRYLILDGTFYSREHRDAVRETGHPVRLIYLECPLEVCLERNEGRPDAIPEKGVRAMAARFQPPGEDEEPIVIRSDRTDPEAAARRVCRRLDGGGEGT